MPGLRLKRIDPGKLTQNIYLNDIEDLSLNKAVEKFKSIEGHTLHCAIEDILDE